MRENCFASKMRWAVILSIVLICAVFLSGKVASAEESGEEDTKYEVVFWARTDPSDDVPDDALSLTTGTGETYNVGFRLPNPYVKKGEILYVKGRNPERYKFVSGYILKRRGGPEERTLTQGEIDTLNRGEALEFVMPGRTYLICFIVKINEAVPTLTPIPSESPTPTVTPTPTVSPYEQYKIEVVGGHAEDVNRNVITAAKAGTTVIVVHDGVPGKYFNTWVEANYPVPKNTPVFSFTMPAQDVSYYAATTRTQHEAVLTLDASPKVITEDWELVLNALISFDHYSYPYYDLDRDGHNDILVQNNGDGLTIYKMEGYSLGNEYIWEGSLAYLGPITIKTNKNVQTVLTPTSEPVDSTEPAPTDYPLIFTPTAGAQEADDDSREGAFNYKILLGAIGAFVATAIIILLVRISKKNNPDDPGDDSGDWRKERVILNASNGESTVIKEDRGNFSGKGEDDNSGGNPE